MTEHPIYGDSFIPSWPADLPVPYNGPFRAKVIDIHDGDTLTLDISLCFDQRKEQVVRVYGMNAPELSTPEGIAARDFLRYLLPCWTPVRFTPLLSSVGQVVYTFGRAVGTIEFGLPKPHLNGVMDNVAACMVRAGHATWCDRDLKVLAGPPPPILRWVQPE